MTATLLRTAGWLAMVSAIATLPLVYLSVRLEGRVDLTARLMETAVQSVGIAIFVVVTLLLKRFLNTICSFHLTDRLIGLMIKANVVICVLAVSSLYLKPLQESLSVFVVVMVVGLGVLQTMFGYRLRQLPHELGGLRTPYCYLNMAIGILSASVVLIPGAILLSAVADVMLGTIFFQAARQASEAATDETP